MRNFDIIKDIDGLETIHRYCAIAEDFQATNPMISVQQARLALETMVKTVYRLKGWQIGERASLLSLTADERFTAFVNSEDLMKRIHYVRKIGNNAAHANDGFVGRRESFFAVLNLYYIVGSIMLAWQVIDTLPDFDKELVPQSAKTSTLTVVPQPDQAQAATTQSADALARAVGESSDAQPATVEARPVVNDLSEAETRKLYIDLLLHEAGWTVTEQVGKIVPRQAGIEIEVQGMPNESGMGYADYVLFDADGTPLAGGVVEAKRTNVDAVAGRHQAELYADCLAARYVCPRPVIYYTNGFETNIIDGIGYPSRKVMGFHTIDELRRMIAQRGRTDITDLQISDRITNRNYQKRMIESVCKHYNSKHRRALLVMATGTGKTRVSISLVDVLVRNNWVKNVLFLADRIELVNQAKRNYAKLLPNMTVSSLRDSDVDISARILFSTYQTMIGHLDKDAKTFSLGRFDLIIIDECHRSIYSDWQKVLTYFKTARLIGMTATPIPETLAFFDNNQVADYTLEQSVVDGVNVGYRIFRIETELGENGGEIEAGDTLKAISRGSGTPHDQTALADRSFEKTQLNRSLFVRDQIRKVLQTYKDAVYTQMYPNREPNFDWLPKTLIFAASDIHAKLIVEVAKEVFGRTDDKFVQRITYSVGNSNALIREFRYNREFRIAVTVTLVATGTDVKPLEVLIFLNDVHSETLYTQMRGRGVRTISDSSLREVTPNADHKDLFYLVDAVGVTASEKFVPGTDAKEKRPLNPSLEHLLEQMALGVVPDDYLQLLAGKLSSIGNRADPEEISEYNALSDVPILDWAERIFDALNHNQLPPYESAEGDNTERLNLIEGLLSNLPARKKLIEIAKGYVKEIVGKTDTVIKAGFSHEEAQKSTHAFETYVRTHRDDIETLRLIYNQESGKLTSALIADLYRKLAEAIPGFNVMRLWSDYRLLDADHVTTLKPGDETQAATNLIQLVRFAYGLITSLYSLTSEAARRFELWCGHRQRELELSPAQKELFRKIAFYVSQNGGCDFRHLRTVMPEIANGLIKWLRSAASANEHIYSLSDFILKAA